MAAINLNQPLIAIIGPTASGKSGLAIEMAKKYNGEIICADSRTVYKEMDIGTAKPSPKQRTEVVHWALDLVRPDQTYSAAAFQVYAHNKIIDIRARGKVPLLVGGTGLYINAVLYDYQFPAAASLEQLRRFENLSKVELYKYCVEHNIELPINDKNKRHLIAAALRDGKAPQRNTQLSDNTYVVGITTNIAELQDRIARRTEHLFEDGVVAEAISLGKKYGWDHESMKGNIYAIIRGSLEENRSDAEIRQRSNTVDYKLSKRQMTWFRRNPEILWTTLDDAPTLFGQLLAPEQ